MNDDEREKMLQALTQDENARKEVLFRAISGMLPLMYPGEEPDIKAVTDNGYIKKVCVYNAGILQITQSVDGDSTSAFVMDIMHAIERAEL